MNLTFSFGFDPVDSVDPFTLIANDGTDAVGFCGGGRLSYEGNALDEGETFLAGGQTFRFARTSRVSRWLCTTAAPSQ